MPATYAGLVLTRTSFSIMRVLRGFGIGIHQLTNSTTSVHYATEVFYALSSLLNFYPWFSIRRSTPPPPAAVRKTAAQNCRPPFGAGNNQPRRDGELTRDRRSGKCAPLALAPPHQESTTKTPTIQPCDTGLLKTNLTCVRTTRWTHHILRLFL